MNQHAIEIIQHRRERVGAGAFEDKTQSFPLCKDGQTRAFRCVVSAEKKMAKLLSGRRTVQTPAVENGFYTYRIYQL